MKGATTKRRARRIHDLIFVGFNGLVAALDRDSGKLVWTWEASKGHHAYVALLLDGNRLVASDSGYTYCLDPLTGREIWHNPLKGLGCGVPSLVSVNGQASDSALLLRAADEEQTAAATGAGGAAG